MRPPSAWTAFLAFLLIVVGQLVMLAHESEKQHTICAEHGELLEVPSLAGVDDHCDHTHFIGVDRAGGGHDDCEIARGLHQAVDTSPTRPLPLVTTIETTIAIAALPVTHDSTTDVLLSAPKTSPPLA